MGWLEGNSILITGGASGLGAAIVRRFVKEGARVTVLDRSQEKLDALKSELGDSILPTHGDVRSFEDNVNSAAAAVREFGTLDTFIGNAGIWDWHVDTLSLPPDHINAAFDEVLQTNVLGYLLGAKASLPHLVSSGGSVIFTLSNAAFYPGGGGPLYTASKFAVRGLIAQLSHEFAPHVRVNGVAPAAIPTDLRGPSSLGLQAQSLTEIPLASIMEKSLPLHGLPSADDYCGAYVYLASKDNSKTMTGGVIECDCGFPARGTNAVAGGEDLPARIHQAA